MSESKNPFFPYLDESESNESGSDCEENRDGENNKRYISVREISLSGSELMTEDLVEVLKNEFVNGNGQKESLKGLSCQVSSIANFKTFSVEFDYCFYCLTKLLLKTQRMQNLSINIISVDYNEADKTTFLRCSTTEDVSEKDLKISAYDIVSGWEKKLLKLNPEKMEFLKSRDKGQKYMDTCLSSVMFLHEDSNSGFGMVCQRNEKLFGVATFVGGVIAMEKQLEKDIELKSYELKEEELKLLESKDWKQLQDKEGEDLMIIQKDASILVIGKSAIVKDFCAKMSSFFDKSHVVMEVTEREVVIKYLDLHCRELTSRPPARVKISFTRKCLKLSGKREDVEEVHDLVRDLIGKLKVISFKELKPGLQAKLFLERGSRTKTLLKEVELINKCAIWVTDLFNPCPNLNIGTKVLEKQSRKTDGHQLGVIKSSNPVNRELHPRIRIRVQSGSITSSQSSMVLVNTLVHSGVDSKKLADCGQVSKSFYAAGGDELQHEFEKHDLPQVFGLDLVSTSAFGSLHCKEVYHIRACKHRNDQSLKLLKDAIKVCINKALSSGHDSIAFPTIGCGKLRYKVQDVCNCFLDAERDFMDSKAMLKITIYALDSELYNLFANFFSPKAQFPTNLRFSVCMKADKIHQIGKIQESLNEKLENVCNKKIEHALIPDYDGLSSECQKSLRDISSCHPQVLIEKDVQNRVINLRGPDSILQTMSQKFKKVLDEELERLKDISFFKKHRGVKAYLEQFLNTEDFELPQHWTNRSDGRNRLRNRLDPKGKLYEKICKLIDKTWDATKAGGKGRDAKNLSHIKIQVTNIFGLKNLGLFLKYRDSQKNLCRQALLNSKNNYKICDITSLGESPIATKGISKFLDNALIQELNEYYLFHGTKADKVDTIINQGIDSRFCSGNAMFGRGAYFTESPTKADQYADHKDSRSGQGCKLHMFLSRVSLGRSYVGRRPEKYSRPPCIDCRGKQECCIPGHKFSDSVVGLNNDLGNKLAFREFVIYAWDQSYPEFLIEYIRV